MSASLVGSEMCIRDRFEATRGLGLPGWALQPIGRPSGPATSGAPVGDPVSYTHLTLPTICSV
eukprot:12142736-Alexandrium_andersonii.AAC.1